MPDFDVAVIGYGPTGLTAASLLGQLGHRVVVIERWPTLYGLPRLTHIDGETARLLSFACNIDEALRDSSRSTRTFSTTRAASSSPTSPKSPVCRWAFLRISRFISRILNRRLIARCEACPM